MYKHTGAPPLGLTPPQRSTPPALHGENEEAQNFEIDGVPPRYVYIHTSIRSAQYINFDTYVKNRKYDEYFTPDLLTDEESSTG